MLCIEYYCHRAVNYGLVEYCLFALVPFWHRNSGGATHIMHFQDGQTSCKSLYSIIKLATFVSYIATFQESAIRKMTNFCQNHAGLIKGLKSTMSFWTIVLGTLSFCHVPKIPWRCNQVNANNKRPLYGGFTF